MNIGNQLYELRKAKNLSQEEVAYQLNVTRQTISKWETNQSLPDLDKIVPLCELYGISADTLLKGTPSETFKTVSDTTHFKQEKAKVISISVFLYFLSVIWVILSESIEEINENIQAGGFLLICAISTAYLIYKMMSFPKEEEEPKKNPYKTIDEVISLLFTVIYFLISFLSKAWGITWIIWVIYALVIQIVHLCLGLKEESHEK